MPPTYSQRGPTLWRVFLSVEVEECIHRQKIRIPSTNYGAHGNFISNQASWPGVEKLNLYTPFEVLVGIVVDMGFTVLPGVKSLYQKEGEGLVLPYVFGMGRKLFGKFTKSR